MNINKVIRLLIATISGSLLLILGISPSFAQPFFHSDLGTGSAGVSSPATIPPKTYNQLSPLSIPGQQATTPISWHIQNVEAPKWFPDLTNRMLQVDGDGHPHVVYGSDSLYYARHDGAIWHYHVVDDSPGAEQYASLALAVTPPYTPHISYYDQLNTSLMYAYYNGTTWQTETVDNTGECGKYSSIALDDEGYPHISYSWRGEYYALKYARRNGSQWNLYTLVTEEQRTGEFSSLAIDGDRQPHIVYFDNLNKNLKYATHDGETWQFELIGGNLDDMRYTTLALAATAPYTPHVGYDTGESVIYATLREASWLTQTIGIYERNGSEGYQGISLIVDSLEIPHISYYYEANNIQRIQYATLSETTWLTQTVASEYYLGYLSTAPSITLDNSDVPHISYYNERSCLA
jgi:hypothetical protein